MLATVAKTVVDFMQRYPGSIILAKGSTPARTRLYQMGISQFWSEIAILFEIKVFKDDNWHPYERGKNFEAFFIVKK